MGFGTDPAGTTPAGFDAATTTEASKRSAPAALAFDGMTRDYELDDEGRYKAVHPVDAKVFLLIRVPLRSIRSTPGTGNGVSDIKHIERQRVQAQVEDHVRVTLAPVVAAGEIRVRGVELDLSVPGRIAYVVNYQNLVTGRNERAFGSS